MGFVISGRFEPTVDSGGLRQSLKDMDIFFFRANGF